MQGIAFADQLAERDGDAYTYMIESEYGVDIRKKLFYQLAERGWPLVGMESLGMSLEDIFISVVETSEGSKADAGQAVRAKRRARTPERRSPESAIGASLVEDAQRQREEMALSDNGEDADE